MATKIYDVEDLILLDNSIIHLEPLKIKFLREFMDVFENVKKAKDDEEAVDKLTDCVVVCMKQFKPELAIKETVEDICDMAMIYKIVELAANIKINNDGKESVVDQADSKASWADFDLVAIESELFLLGSWKNYEELELSMSLPEVISILTSKRDLDYQEKRFFAAMQGVDLDKNSKQEPNAWDKLKAKVFSGGATDDSNDILALQGINAQMAGFGIGNGLSYEKWD